MSKKFYIGKTASVTKAIISYLKSKNGFNTAPVSNVELLMNNLLQDQKGRLDDTDVLGVYFEARYLGLNFLIEISRDFLLYRLSRLESISHSDYEYLLFVLLKAAVRVNDDYLFEKCAEKFLNSENEHFVLADFLKKLEISIHSRFVLRALEKRLKKIGKMYLIIRIHIYV